MRELNPRPQSKDAHSKQLSHGSAASLRRFACLNPIKPYSFCDFPDANGDLFFQRPGHHVRARQRRNVYVLVGTIVQKIQPDIVALAQCTSVPNGFGFDIDISSAVPPPPRSTAISSRRKSTGSLWVLSNFRTGSGSAY